MTIIAERRPNANLRGRSVPAQRLLAARIGNELSGEDIGERRHAFYHALWAVNHGSAATLDCCKHPALCTDIRERGVSLVNRIERLTAATYAKNPKKWAAEIWELETLIGVAHASAYLPEVLDAFIEQIRADRARRKERAQQSMRTRAQERAALILAGDVDSFPIGNEDCTTDLTLHYLAVHFNSARPSESKVVLRRAVEVDERLRELDA